MSLEKAVKPVFFATEKAVTLDHPKRYAEVSGDCNPIHLDEAFARRVGLKGTILHGLCTMGFVAQHVAQAVQDPGKIRKLKLRFSTPVYPGDLLKIQSEILEQNEATLRLKIRCANQHGEEVLSGAQAECHSSAQPLQSVAASGETFPAEEFRIEKERIQAYAQVLGDPYPIYESGKIAPPLFCSLFAMRPFLKAFLAKADSLETKMRIIHGGQEFEFARLLKAGERITTKGAIERRSSRAGQEFIYFVTESRDEEKSLVVLGRWLAIMTAA